MPEQPKPPPRGDVTAVRVHQETTREARFYELEFSDGKQVWREKLWSVTTLLDLLDKPAIVHWAANETAAAAMRDRAHLEADVQRYGLAEATKRLAQSRFAKKEKAGDVGTIVHKQIEAIINGPETQAPPIPEPLREEVLARVAQFRRFCDEWRPEFRGSEMTVYHPEHGWSGTLDTLAEVGTWGLGLVDFKNTNPSGPKKDQPGVYYEHGLQVTAYSHARYIVPSLGAWLAPIPMPPVKWGAVLWLHTDRYELVRVDISDANYEAFRMAGQLYRWKDGPRGRGILLGRSTPAMAGILPTVEENNAAAAGAPPGARLINEAQRKRMMAVAAKAGLKHADLKTWLEAEHKILSTKAVPLMLYDLIIAALEGQQDPGSDAPPPEGAAA